MKFLRYIFLFALTGLFFSCKKFLDVKPKESVPDDQTIFDNVSAQEALNGVYSALGAENYYGTAFQSIGYLSGDNIVWTGSQSQVQEFINHKVSAENSTIAAVWPAIYTTINRANQVISKVPSVEDPALTDSLHNQYIGEAYFLRALAYFDLARTWGGVPIITEPTLNYSDNSGIARSTVAEVYAQVLNDLDRAENLLPATTNRYHATRKTVWALKARYHLYNTNWAKAEEYANKLIEDAGSYELVKPYNSFFANNARGTKESVFEIFYNGTTEVNNHRGQWQPQTNGGTRQWAPNDALVALLSDSATGGGRAALIAKDNQNRWYGNLYYRSPAADPTYVIRIAELYLIRAEARAQQDNAQGALADLNAVRDRAALAPSAAVSKDEILLAIENERRLEFALEPHRWFDLVRTGQAATVLNINDVNRYVLPIPSQQLLVDKALVQNPGY
jgi:hypothetical protein